MSYLPRSTVAQARPAPISDRLLDQLRRIAHDAPNGLASEAEAEWLLSTCGPLLDELATRRAVMGAAALPSIGAEIITLPGSR